MSSARKYLNSPLWATAGQAAYWLLLMAGCAVMMVMNHYTTLKEDDFLHATIYGTGGEPINSLWDVLRSWWYHYQSHDGRVANLPDFLFNGLLGKPAFDICNTLMFGLMAHLISRHATGRNSAVVLAMLFAYITAAWPVPGETLLWLAGSCNYLWTITASLLFIAYLLWHRNPRPGWIHSIAVVLLAFLAGAANEGTTMGIGAGLVLYYLFNRGKVDRAVIMAMAGYLLGILWLLSSPGAWERASYDISRDAGPMQLLMERCMMLKTMTIEFITPIAALLLGIIACIKNGVKRTFTSSPWPFIYLCLLAFVFLLGKNSARMYTAFACVSFIIMAMALNSIFKRWWWIAAMVSLVGLAVCASKLSYNIGQVKLYNEFFKATEQDIRDSDDDQAILTVHDFPGYSRFVKLFALDSWNHFIHEKTLVMHYGKGNLQFVNDSIHVRYHEGRLTDGAQPMPFTTDRPSDIQGIYGVPGQQYMLVKTYYPAITHTDQLTQAIDTDGNPVFLPPHYFPIKYQGTVYLIFPVLDNTIASVTSFPLGEDQPSLTLTRTAPNPTWAVLPPVWHP